MLRPARESRCAQLCRPRATFHAFLSPVSIPVLTAQHDCDAGNVVYPEVDGFETLLRFPVSSAAGCRVILHPAWGSHVYPATLFTNAPPEAVEQALRAVGNA